MKFPWPTFCLLLIGSWGCDASGGRVDSMASNPSTEESTADIEAQTNSGVALAGKFVFQGREYRIEKAEILAAISDPYWCDKYNRGQGKSLSWLIGFETASSGSRSELGIAEFPGPNIDFDGLPIQIKNWHDLKGLEFKWKDPIDPATGEHLGTMYVHDHQSIKNGQVRITSMDGVIFHIVASGQNEEGQEFSIDAPAEFNSIRVHGSEMDNDESIRARLREQIDDSNLSGTPFKLDSDFKYQSGVRGGEAIFTPKL